MVLIKLILTTRLEHVCHQMDCQPNNIIRMEPLFDHEGSELFLLKLGYNGTPATLAPEVLGCKLAISVASECNGLPLGISVLARTMKGVNGIHQWRHTLNKLRNSKMGEEMEQEVFKVLKLSYDNLIDKNMQQCFLCCASLDSMRKEELIMMLVDEGLIKGMRSLEEIFDEGFAILNKLRGHSLLSLYDDGITINYVYMNGLVRDMACRILKIEESHRYLVKCRKGLTKIPDMQEWTPDLEKVSLAGNEIEEIEAGTSPMCRRLSTLNFSGNHLSGIPDCFFTHMTFLAVLDLSSNCQLKRLPNSLSDLRSLVSLLLEGCESLEYVPPLGELKALSRLAITSTEIEEVPQGLEMLTNLKWLDLSWNWKLRFAPAVSVLSRLTNLQFLDVRAELAYTSVIVKLEDLQRMNMLECFACKVHDCENFNDYVFKILDKGCGPKTYCLTFGIENETSFQDNIYLSADFRRVQCGDCEEFIHLLPSNLVELRLEDNKHWRCLCNALSFSGPSSLRSCEIDGCPELESLFCCLSGGTSSCSLCSNLQNLESLILDRLESLAVIWKHLPLRGEFFHLKHLRIRECRKIEELLTAGSLPLLHSLATIRVDTCNSMKEIFAVGSDEDDNVHVTPITLHLPKLEKLKLRCLPQLKTVGCETIVCESSAKLDIRDCPNLQSHPTVQLYESSS